MKIAIVTEDGETISRHFGRAPYYLVVTVDNGATVKRERRDKAGHAQFAGQVHEHEHHAGGALGHGFDSESRERHGRMASTITDCSVLLAGGMGAGAYESLKQAGITPIITDVDKIEEAVSAYLAGTLTDHTERLH